MVSRIEIFSHHVLTVSRTAVSLAISRDGSSGGVVRMAVITEAGVERVFVPGNELPTFRGGTMGSEGKRIPTEVAA